MVKQYGRKKEVDVINSCFYILDYLKFVDITKDKIITTLNYNTEKYITSYKEYFDELISKLIKLFTDIKIKLNNKIFNPKCYIVNNQSNKIHRNLILYSILKYTYQEPTEIIYDGDTCYISNLKEISFKDKLDSGKPFPRFSTSLKINYSDNYSDLNLNLTENTGSSDIKTNIKYVLEKDYNVLFGTNGHIIIIIGFENKTDDDDILLNVKNSWGKCNSYEKTWCNLIERNQISMNKLLKWDKEVLLYFFYPIDYTYLKTKALTSLDLEKNNIGDEGEPALAEALKTNTTLTELNLDNNNIDDKGATVLAEALKTNRTLTQLKLGFNIIGDDGAKAIGTVLETNNIMKILKLYFNKIGVNGAIALIQNSTLRILDLNTNSIGNNNATGLANALKKNKTLKQLNLSKNNIGDEGATALATALIQTLEILVLDDNNIGDIGAIALGNGLGTNTTLKYLYLIKNMIGDEGATAIAKGLNITKTLTTLDLTKNKIGDDGAKALAEGLTLNEIKLSGNTNISDEIKTEILDKEKRIIFN